MYGGVSEIESVGGVEMPEFTYAHVVAIMLLAIPMAAILFSLVGFVAYTISYLTGAQDGKYAVRDRWGTGFRGFIKGLFD